MNTLEVAAAFVPEEGQPATPADKTQAVAAQRKRHRSWLRREKGPDGHKAAWRPRKRYRVSAEKWILAVDNAIKHSTSLPGLAFAKFNSLNNVWRPSNWRKWPHTTCTIDQGGDGLSAVHALMYMLLLNITVLYDWCHGAQRDFFVTFKAIGHFSTMLLFLCIFNFAQGPDKEEGMRFQQVQEALQDMVDKHIDPENFPLLCEYSDQMISELKDTMGLDGLQSPLHSLWEFIKSNALFTKKQYRVKLCEWGAWVAAAEAFLAMYTFTRFKCEYVCLEMDMFGSKGFTKKIIVNREHIKAAAETTTTSIDVTQVDTEILRSCSQTVLVSSVAVMAEPNYKRVLAIMALSCSHIKHWQGSASKAMKSVASNAEWLLLQHKSGFIGHLLETWATLSDMKVLRAALFLEFEGAQVDELVVIAELDDDFAKLQGRTVQHLIAARIRRLLYCWLGWPHRHQRCKLGDQMAELTMKAFQQDHEAYECVATSPSFHQCRQGPVIAAMLQRSLFHLVVNKQFLAACAETKYRADPDLVQLDTEHMSGVLSSVVVEDVNNVQKNSRQARGSMKFRRPERAMAVAVASKVLESRHKYIAIEPSSDVSRVGDVIGPEAFGKSGTTVQLSLSVKGVATYAQKANYFSPQAVNVSLPTADLAVLSELRKFPTLRAKAEFGIMGAFAVPGHAFIFSRAGNKGTSFSWHIGMGYFKDSSIVGWPVALKKVPGHSDMFTIEVTKAVTQPSVFAIFAWDNIEAIDFNWRSWAWQSLYLQRAVEHWQPATRMVTTAKAQPLIKVVAQLSWLDFDSSTVKSVCKHAAKITDFPGGASLLEVLLHATMKVLKLDEDDALTVLRQRLLKPKSKDDEGTKALLELDEAMKCVEPADADVIGTEQKNSRGWCSPCRVCW